MRFKFVSVLGCSCFLGFTAGDGALDDPPDDAELCLFLSRSVGSNLLKDAFDPLDDDALLPPADVVLIPSTFLFAQTSRLAVFCPRLMMVRSLLLSCASSE
jgi:hypothetical protein